MSRSRLSKFTCFIIVVALIGSLACTTDEPAPALTTITVVLPIPSLTAGLTETPTAAGLDQNGAAIGAGTVSWGSSTPGVATINSSSGLITAVAPGTTSITATSGTVSGNALLTVTAVVPTLTTIVVTLPFTTAAIGQTETATAGGLDQGGAAISAGTIAWSSSAQTVATINPVSGLITALAAGSTTITATSGTKSGQRLLTVAAPAAIKINEVESNGGTPGDWAEFYNPTAAAVDISGWVMKDNDDTHSYAFPAGTTIGANGYLVADEANFVFGLGSADAVRLYNPFGVLVDSYTWTAHAATTYARCPNIIGGFNTATTSTKGTANDCSGASPVVTPWPGSDDVTTVDGVSVFQTNLSGLFYEGAAGGNPAVLWAARNGPGTVFRLIFNGTIWTPDAANGWGAGKADKYLDGTGNPDTEGITCALTCATGGIYVSTERNNDASTVSRSSILRFDANQAGTTLTATNDWNITGDLPVTGANLGIEDITWVPDAFLVAQGFFDESAGHAYNPAEYASHNGGIFFVGLEANGMIYAYALNHSNNTFKRIATIATGFTGVMGLQFDRELNYLWATCDDGCGNKAETLEIDVGAGSPTLGRFLPTHLFDKPSTMSNINNEGFAFAPQSECVAGKKPVFWTDDGETGGHSIRKATIPCTRFP